MTAEEYGKQFVEEYGVPLTDDEEQRAALAAKAAGAAYLYECWGNSVIEYKELITPIINNVVEANRELMDAAGVVMRFFPAQYKWVSPEIDFRHPESLRTQGDRVLYQEELLGKIASLLVWKSADAVGEDEVYYFPIYYDIWIQAVITQENASELLQQIERGY